MALSRLPERAGGRFGGADLPVGRAWAEIDLDAIRDNIRALRRILSPNTRLMAVVKADAYGHGAVQVSRAAIEAGAWILGVATVDEGVELRRAGLSAPVLVLGPTAPEDAEAAVAHDLAVTVFQADVGQALSLAAGRIGRPARVHIKVDTGMNRIGVPPRDAAALARTLGAMPNVVLDGCLTHFASADEPDLAPARAQLETFRAALDDLKAAGIAIRFRHAANSAAALALPDAHLDIVRCGIAVYGVLPAPHLAGRVPLRAAMRFRARVAHVRRVDAGAPVGYGGGYRCPSATTIATIPVGYADGYPRLAELEARVVFRGRRLRLAGRISMDQMMVDAGDLPVRVGDEMELWGGAMAVDEVARAAQTISYELLARVSRRIPRVFMQDGRVRAVRTLCENSTDT